MTKTSYPLCGCSGHPRLNNASVHVACPAGNSSSFCAVPRHTGKPSLMYAGRMLFAHDLSKKLPLLW